MIKGKEEEAIRWDEVQEIRGYGIFHVRRMDGSNLVLSEALLRSKGLRQIIENGIAQRLLPQAIEQYERGETVHFGRLRVGRDGVSRDEQHIPWTMLEDVRYRKGKLLIKFNGKWQRWANSFWVLRVQNLPPNVPVFGMLVQYVLEQGRPT